MRKLALLAACAALLLVPTDGAAQTITGAQFCLNGDTTPGCDPVASILLTPFQNLDLDEAEWEPDDGDGAICSLQVGMVDDVKLWIHVFLQDSSTVTPGTTVANMTYLVPTDPTPGVSGNLISNGWCYAYMTGITLYASTGPLTTDTTGPNAASQLIVVVGLK